MVGSPPRTTLHADPLPPVGDAETLLMLRALADASPDAMYVKDVHGRYLLINEAGAKLVGRRVDEVIGHDDRALFSAETAAGLMADDRAVMESGQARQVEEIGTAAGSTRIYLSDKRPLRDTAGQVVGVFGVSRDLTERRQMEVLLHLEKDVVELLGRHEPLSVIFDAVTLGMEQLAPGLLASILVLDGGGRLLHGSAPSLAEAYSAAIHGIAIGPGVGSCGTAAHHRQRVIVSDIATDPLWRDFKDLALAHGLRACWSTPIISIAGDVLGTFAMYYREPRAPNTFELALADAAANIVRMAIERRRTEDERTRLLAAERQARAEADLGRERLHRLFEEAPAFISITRGPDHILELINRRARAFIGQRNVVGKPLRQAFPELAGQADVVAIFDRVYQSGEPVEIAELPVSLDRRGTGTLEPGYFNLRYEPLRGTDGAIEGVMGFSFDVTDQVQARQQVEDENRIIDTLGRIGATLTAKLELNEILQAVTDASTALTGAQFGAFFYNGVTASGEAYLLYTLSGAPREAFSKFPAPRATALFGPTFRGEGIVRIDDVKQDPRYGLSAPYHGMPPGHLPVRSYLAVPVTSRSGEVLGGLFFGHAEPARFTERHERLVAGVAAQAAIAVDNARMFDAARVARADAEAALEARDRFLSAASHELKNPLNALQLHLVGLRRLVTSGRADAATIPGRVEKAEQQVGRLVRLVDNLLDVSRITAGRLPLEIEPTDLAAVAAEVVQQLQPQLPEGASIAILGPKLIEGRWDRLRLEQILVNLLTNAIKYGEGKPIDLIFRDAGDRVSFDVVDRGIGIAPEDRDRLFQRFERLVQERRHAGFGLGLWITREVVDALGGTIDVRSELGRGTTFTVTLPRDSTPGQTS